MTFIESACVWANGVRSVEDPELRNARLCTLADIPALMVTRGIWTQVGGWFALFFADRRWATAWIVADLLLIAARTVLNQRIRRQGEFTPFRTHAAMTIVNVLSFSVLCPATCALMFTRQRELVSLGIMIGVGWMGFVFARQVASPRLGGLYLISLGVAMTLGLHGAGLDLLAMLIPPAIGTFYIILLQNHSILATTLAAQHADRQLSLHDRLTGLPNRLFLDEYTARFGAGASTQRERKGVAALYLDLDGFKDVNDLHGHGAGDTVLQAVAGRIRATVRDGDFVCRLGGDEFVILLPGADRDDAVRAADRLLNACREPISLGGSAVATIGVSIGISLDTELTEIPRLIEAADEALGVSKRTGKDRWSLT